MPSTALSPTASWIDVNLHDGDRSGYAGSTWVSRFKTSFNLTWRSAAFLICSIKIFNNKSNYPGRRRAFSVLHSSPPYSPKSIPFFYRGLATDMYAIRSFRSLFFPPR